MAVKRILVLGGYGNFGKRIVESLALENIQLLIAGRNVERGRQLVQQLSLGILGQHRFIDSNLLGPAPWLVINKAQSR